MLIAILMENWDNSIWIEQQLIINDVFLLQLLTILAVLRKIF